MKHWPILLVSLLSYVAISGSWAFVAAVTMKDITSDFGVSIGTFSSVVGVFLLVKTGLHIFVSGPLMSIVGAHRLANLVLFSIGVIDVAAGSAANMNYLFVALGANYLLSAFADQPTYIYLASQYFDEHLPFATATLASGYSAAGFVFPLIIGPLLVTYSWRVVWWAVAGVTLVLVPLSVATLKPGPRDLPASSSKSIATMYVSSFATLASQPMFWVLNVACICLMVYGGLISAHLPTLLRTDAQLDALQATRLYSFQYGAAVCGKLLTGVVLKRLPRWLLFTVPPITFALSHFVLVDVCWVDCLAINDLFDPVSTWDGIRSLVDCQTIVHDPTRILVYCATVGLSFGFTFSLLTCQPAQLFGRAQLPTAQSISFACLVFGLTLGNSLVGLLRDAFDTYRASLVLSFATSTLAALLCVILIPGLPSERHAKDMI